MKNSHIEGWKTQTEFVGEYMHHGKKWGLNFFAVDNEDAVEKLKSIKSSLVILGVLDCVIPMVSTVGADDDHQIT